MPWIPRGLRNGVVTTRYPKRFDVEAGAVHTAVSVVARGPDERTHDAQRACPTGAITIDAQRVALDRGRCILCGRCTRLDPATFRDELNPEVAVVRRSHLVVPMTDETDDELDRLQGELHRRVRALRRSVFIRHVDAGSDGSDEWEVAALTNPIYDIQRLGLYFTASPKHADLLLVTGAGSAGMLGPLRHTLSVMPRPLVVVAAGVDAISGGVVGESYATRGGVLDVVPADVVVPGAPPSPFSLLHGILLGVGVLGNARSASTIAHAGARP